MNTGERWGQGKNTRHGAWVRRYGPRDRGQGTMRKDTDRDTEAGRTLMLTGTLTLSGTLTLTGTLTSTGTLTRTGALTL